MSRAITLHQPWASLIALGVKTIETRSWSTKYRGPLAIHAAARQPTAADFGDSVPARAGWIGRYNLGAWAEHVVHADPCDCDEDEELIGERCGGLSDAQPALLNDEGAHGFSLATTLPLGAVVATCTLADVVPMTDGHPCGVGKVVHLAIEQRGLTLCRDWRQVNVSDQLPYGDFAPGRFAWLLTDIEPTAPPIPAKGKQGLWRWAR